MQQQQLDLVFSSLSDPTRREILEKISGFSIGFEPTVSQIAKPFNMSLPAITKHLNVLEKSGLVKREKHGREIKVRLDPSPLKEASRYISFYRQFWSNQFDNLEKYLRDKQEAINKKIDWR